MKISINIALGIILGFQFNHENYVSVVFCLFIIGIFNLCYLVYDSLGLENEFRRKIIQSDLQRKNNQLIKKIKKNSNVEI